jgi:hypothetical protein
MNRYVHIYSVMNNTSKTRKLRPSSEAISVPFINKARFLLAHCLVSLNTISGPYLYETVGSASIPGSLSIALCYKADESADESKK